MKKSSVQNLLNRLESVKDSIKDPIRERVRKHIFDKNDVITEEDIRNINFKVFKPFKPGEKVIPG